MSVIVYVLDLPEFSSLVRSGRATVGCTVSPMGNGYWKMEAERELRFMRKELGLGPALWNSVLCGGFRGRIAAYDRNEMRLLAEGDNP